MRNILYYIIIFLWSFLLCAQDIGITTTSMQGKPAYLVQAGVFSLQKDAERLQNTLASSIPYTIKIDHIQDQGLYIVQVGPIDDLARAHLIQQQIRSNSTTDNSTNYNKNPISAPVAPKINSAKTWNLRNAEIRAVIEEISKVTGKNFILDPHVTGKISIVSSTPISDKELYPVFLSMLQVSGFAAIPSGDIIKIVPNMDARTQSPDLINRLHSSGYGDEMMVEVVPVHHVPAEQLVPVLRPLMPQWSNVSAYGPSNMLILSGRASNIRQLTEIIKQVDSSSANGIDMIPLKHALAMDVANTLKDLVKSQPNIGNHVQPMLAADDRSNSILLSGSKTDRIRFRLLISQLDLGQSNNSDSNTQVIYLNYLRAEDLVPILAGIAQASFSGTVGTTIGTITQPILDSTNPAASMLGLSAQGNNNHASPSPTAGQTSNSSIAQNTSSATTQNEGSTKPTAQILAEPNTNSIIINAPAALIRTLKSVISQLDIKPAQLLIEALVAEINESDFNTLGVEWGSVGQRNADNTFRPGFAILNSKTTLSQFQAQLYALERQHKANILSTPSVVVLDNRQAKIIIGKQVSVATSSYPNNANATTTASPYTTFDRMDVALHLYVRPQITRGKGIQLQIDQGNDTLDTVDPNGSNTTPTFNISAIVTSVHVESGDVIVLGGLAQDTLANDNDNVPILGDIPGIGRLFQHIRTNREKKVLMVFIRPKILKNERDNLEVTGSKYNHMRQDQIDIARSQEVYRKTDMHTVAPAWHTSKLPKPFCRLTPNRLEK
jgi:general secretion pathway protein D